MTFNTLEDAFRFYLNTPDAEGLPAPTEQYRFAAYAVGGPGKGLRRRLEEAGLRDWRFDFAWPEFRVAVELEGGTWVRGRHTRPAGFEGDCWKYNSAQLMGWVVLRYTGDMLHDHTPLVLAHLRRALGLQGEKANEDTRIPPARESAGRAASGGARQEKQASRNHRRAGSGKARALHALPEHQSEPP